ncbi:MAG: phosphoenolpyruvate--protein phosphotransferase [Ruminococcus sp.]|nr:phosphoenolpyruvate--protein phosphotransferase [Ruminococcus sp.]
MLVCHGKGVCDGIAIGKIKILKKSESNIKKIHISDIEKEVTRFHNARDNAKKQLRQLCAKAESELGEESAAIFEIHSMMIEDSDYIESIENIIKAQEINAEYAVLKTGENFFEMFSSMDDDYMKSRSIDVKDISDRIIKNLLNTDNDENKLYDKTIILAEDLVPSETVRIDKDKVLSFVTINGSSNSHTAILARTLSIPSIVSCNINMDSKFDGKTAIVDGFTGEIYIDPDSVTVEKMKTKMKETDLQREQLNTLKGKENITVDGKKVKLYANIGNIRDIASVLTNDGNGIGLFRSEFIYLERNKFPTEEEQFCIYKKAAETMGRNKIIIRTLDIGSDKKVDYFNLKKEENSAMGYRAIRICLKEPEIFRTQLRAIYRASIYGNISVMYPMITSIEEVKKIKDIAKEVRNELENEGVKIGNVEQGIMIETPAAVLISDELAKEVDFFSIGTNDLTQYTLAIDRQNEKLDDFYNPYHKSVLKMIKMVIDNAHKNNIWAGICGELGADINITELLLAFGIDEISVSSSAILKVRKKIRETDTRKVNIRKWL